jgi:serine/threonine protein kinase
MAPEVMVSGGAVDCGYTYSADIWSLGCVVIGNYSFNLI